MGIANNGEIYRQWELVDNGKSQNSYNGNDRQWGIKDNWKLYTMGNDK